MSQNNSSFGPELGNEQPCILLSAEVEPGVLYLGKLSDRTVEEISSIVELTDLGLHSDEVESKKRKYDIQSNNVQNI